MNISILASIWCQNLWDELILKNEINLIKNSLFNDLDFKKWKKINKHKLLKEENFNFRVFTYDKKNLFFKEKNINYIEYFPVWIRKIKNIFKNIKNFFCFIDTVMWSNLIIIWWGWIIYDNEIQTNKDPLDQMIFRNKFFRFFRKKVVFYAVWINIKNEENLKKLKKICKKVYKIYVRDFFSYETLKKIWINSEIIPDPVFFDDLEDFEDLDFKNYPKFENNFLIRDVKVSEFNLRDLWNINFRNKKVWITFRKWQFSKIQNEKMEIFIIKEILLFLLKQNATIYFLPHSIHPSDLNSNDLIYYKKIIKETWLVWKAEIVENINEVYKFYKEEKLDVCLSMRLHSMILSQVYGIPYIAFSYSKKTDELIKNIKNIK